MEFSIEKKVFMKMKSNILSKTQNNGLRDFVRGLFKQAEIENKIGFRP